MKCPKVAHLKSDLSACSLPHLVLRHHYHFSHAAEVQVTSATEFIVWGGHFYVGTGTKRVEKGDMEGAPTEKNSNPFLKCSELFGREITKEGSQIVSIGGGKCDITSPKTLGTKNSVKNLGFPRRTVPAAIFVRVGTAVREPNVLFLSVKSQ